MADIGNVLDSIFKPEWLTIVHAAEALGTHVEGDVAAQVKTDLQAVQGQLSTALNGAAAIATAAQSKIDATVNPIVNKGIEAAGAAIAAAYPPMAPLIAAAEGEAEKLADGGTDAILLALITKAAAFLSQAGKTVAAVNLSNIAGGKVSNPLDSLIAWFGEQLIRNADDKLVDTLVQRGDITPAQAPVLKQAGPIYVQALLAEVQAAQHK